MYHIALSVLIATVVTVIFALIFGGSATAIGAGIIPGLIAGGGFFFWRSRVVAKDMEAMMAEVQNVLGAPAQVTTIQERDQLRRRRTTKAIEIIERGYKWEKWHPGIRGQLDGQIGTLLYVDGQNIPATPYLAKTSPRHWVAQAMYGCVAFKRNQIPEMKEAFERAVRFNKKEALLWNVYAWCVWKKGDIDEAIAVLNRAKKHVGSDAGTQANLEALSNQRPMRMDGWGEAWMQFRLDDSLQRQQAAMMQPKARMDRRSMYRGR